MVDREPPVRGPRCATLSLDGDEPILGTATTDVRWLFVEVRGPWGAQALAESRLPGDVRNRLQSLEGVRVQLIRRYGKDADREPGVRAFAVEVHPGQPTATRTALLGSAAALVELGWPDPADSSWAEHLDPLWFVCTNGARDVCCAEQGRPVAGVLDARWPGATWETTHLGGHRFAATLLAVPSGLMLGRLAASTAVDVCERVLAGEVPEDYARGLVGLSPAAQVAQAHVVREQGAPAVVEAEQEVGPGKRVVRVVGAQQQWQVTVSETRAAQVASCGADAKEVASYRIARAVPVG